MTHTPSRSFSAAEVLVALVLVLVLATFLAPLVFRSKNRHFPRSKCANNLRQIGLAAVQYGDDRRFLPHMNSNVRALDGGIDSSDTPRAIRSLVWAGYHDNPEGFTCPASDDRDWPIEDPQVKADMRRWAFAGAYLDAAAAEAPPWTDPNPRDPTLRETSELSFAYTRRGYNRNLHSNRILGADRALAPADPDAPTRDLAPSDGGNHRDGWQVLRGDCSVDLQPATRAAFEALVGEEKDQGALPLSAANVPD